MLFTYTYRSSDGRRHSAEIEAESRDAAFAKVRSELGVKPIKVVVSAAQGRGGQLARSAAGGNSKARKLASSKTSIAVAIAIVLSLTAAVWFAMRSGDTSVDALAREPGRYNSGTFAAYTNLVAQARQLQDAARRRLDGLELDLLSNYALVERMKDAKFFTDRISLGYRAIDKSRAETRELFRTLYEVFPAECRNERLDAQRLYSETMDGIDAVEERLVVADKTFRMLDSNRGKWHVRKGEVVWNDESLGKEFDFLSKAATSSTARWERDFSSRAGE